MFEPQHTIHDTTTGKQQGSRVNDVMDLPPEEVQFIVCENVFANPFTVCSRSWTIRVSGSSI
eukprot:SAG31_NODE_1639_length_7669_cov_13.434082_4_plen_62_part_00